MSSKECNRLINQTVRRALIDDSSNDVDAVTVQFLKLFISLTPSVYKAVYRITCEKDLYPSINGGILKHRGCVGHIA